MLFRVADITAIATVAHEHGALVCFDNSWATPLLQKPLTLGADIVVHSASKYLGGHSDLMAGAVVTSADDRLAKARLAAAGHTVGGLLVSRSLLVTALVAILASGAAAQQEMCGAPGLTVSVVPKSAPPGQTITVTITNNSTQMWQLSSSCVFTAIHANELPGAMALHHLMPMLVAADRAGRVNGEIVVVPTVNPIGLAQLVGNNHLGRYDFLGRENFNRNWLDLSEPVADRLDGILSSDTERNVAADFGLKGGPVLVEGGQGCQRSVIWRRKRG